MAFYLNTISSIFFRKYCLFLFLEFINIFCSLYVQFLFWLIKLYVRKLLLLNKKIYNIPLANTAWLGNFKPLLTYPVGSYPYPAASISRQPIKCFIIFHQQKKSLCSYKRNINCFNEDSFRNTKWEKFFEFLRRNPIWINLTKRIFKQCLVRFL